MTERGRNDELSDEEIAKLDALLEMPAIWAEPDPADEEFIVAAILAEAANTPRAVTEDAPLTVRDEVTDRPHSRTGPQATHTPNHDNGATVVPISSARSWLTPALSAVAGVIVALIGVAAFVTITSQPEDGLIELALDGTDLAPEAQATARIVDLPAGTRVELDVSMLEPAAPGTYYEVWLRKDAEVGVSAGTFHLRAGDSDIELWAGVSTDDYPLITVTVQQEADSTSSGRVVLRGLVGSN